MSTPTTKQVELRLIPAPGQPPEFLATLEPTAGKAPSLWSMLGKHVVLEGYTRDSWAYDTSTDQWSTLQVKSVDGRQKLPGFVQHLRSRQKTAFGRFASATTRGTTTMILVVSYKQMSSSTLNCRVAPLTSLAAAKCPLKPLQPKVVAPVVNIKPSSSKPNAPPSSAVAAKPQPKLKPNNPAPTLKKKSGFGLLGNLVGAQRRTNQQVQAAATVVPKSKPSGGGDASSTTSAPAGSDASSTAAATTQSLKTAGEVLADFRQEMEQKMLDFDISSDPKLEVKLDLPAKMRLLSENDQQSGRVTMEVLKYIVYEQAEEVNEEWIAHKEPSEFVDEVAISIYKEGEAPPEVLEDVNRAELPDEIRGQQRAIQEQRQKAEQIRAQKLQMEQTKAALAGGCNNDDDADLDLAALNTKKRDRRTIEDFEREAKRRRGD